LHGAIFKSKVAYQLEVPAILIVPVLPHGLQVLVNSFWNKRFLLQLSTSHINFPLWVNSHLDKEDVHLTVQHCPIHPLKLNTVHAAEHLFHSSLFLQEFHLSQYAVW